MDKYIDKNVLFYGLVILAIIIWSFDGLYNFVGWIKAW